MDLLACAECGSRFYAPGVGPSTRRGCPQCGGDLVLALNGMRSIPLDARWLDARVAPGGAQTVTAMAEGDGIRSEGLA
jgi:predicted  nucleic acid-binding Zn-ribbon protein